MTFVEDLLCQHRERYPAMELADLYKLLHQAAMGPAHAQAPGASTLARLQSEAEAMGSGPMEPAIDPISPLDELCRVHLRPRAREGHAWAALASAAEHTAKSFEASTARLDDYCARLLKLMDSGRLPGDGADARRWLADVATAGYPAVHHSEAFRVAYAPAYRVVSVSALRAACESFLRSS